MKSLSFPPRETRSLCQEPRLRGLIRVLDLDNQLAYISTELAIFVIQMGE